MSARLSESDRKLFSTVSDAAFANPFGQERQSLDAQMTEGRADDPKWVQRMLSRVETRLAAAAEGRFRVDAFSERDRLLVEYTFLFTVFHRYVDRLDALIVAQEQAERPLRVSFAPELLRSITNVGLSQARAVRVFELFYQMRRAYAFIKRGLTGRSASMQRLRQQLWQALFTHDIRRYERHLWDRMEDFATILLGETGTGKGAAAKALGLSGFIPFDAKAGAFTYAFHDGFVPINLNEFPEALFESEIFGHRKGAFPGAVDHHEGVLSRCKDHGTVFLDEIGEATLPVQVKLLRVLQDRSYTPVGSRQPQRFSGRIIAATHRSLDALRASGAMRDDFYYRLCSNVIVVPPLRERIVEDPSELSDLVQHLCARIAGASDENLVATVLSAIERDLGAGHPFVGNVRELEQCVRRVLLTGSCTPDRTPAPSSPHEALLHAFDHGTWTANQLIAHYCRTLYARTGSYVQVANLTALDRRTVKKHITHAD